MALQWTKLTGTTATGGAATITSINRVTGKLHAVEWIDGDLADGVNAVLSVVRDDTAPDYTLLTLTDANNDAVYYPRVIIHSEAGAALTGTSGGDRAMPIINGQLQLAITSGGDAKTGGAIVYYEV
jgi:hypothetical protein